MPDKTPASRCIIIPAIKKNAVIPDQLVKKLAGITLIQRALNTAKTIMPDEDIHVITDSEEISLICQRNRVNYHYDKDLRFTSANILTELKEYLQKLGNKYEHLLIYRASAPLVDHQDIEKGYDLFRQTHADILVTLKKYDKRLWNQQNGTLDKLICDDRTSSFMVEIKSFLIVQAKALQDHCSELTVTPYFLDEKAIEIDSYQDWWICEKLLNQKHIVFVVTGYPAIGLGHIFRAITLAHEITDHRITFLCTRESELAVRQIAEKDYKTVLQQDDLLEDVLKLNPDLVINDILNTDPRYIQPLKKNNIKAVNFEDIGPGAHDADLVINAIYPPDTSHADHMLCGHPYFCLRDEFQDARKRRFREKIQNLLITFGGTDPNNYTLHIFQAVKDICVQKDIKIYVVTGPGYLHQKSFAAYLSGVKDCDCEHIHKTGIMSAIMEKSDLAISSAGRTVFELAHMRIPGIIISQNAREHTHYFARPEFGFEYLGYMAKVDTEKIAESLKKMLDPDYRKTLYNQMKQFQFERNKNRVIKKILGLLEE